MLKGVLAAFVARSCASKAGIARKTNRAMNAVDFISRAVLQKPARKTKNNSPSLWLYPLDTKAFYCSNEQYDKVEPATDGGAGFHRLGMGFGAALPKPSGDCRAFRLCQLVCGRLPCPRAAAQGCAGCGSRKSALAPAGGCVPCSAPFDGGGDTAFRRHSGRLRARAGAGSRGLRFGGHQ